MEKKHKTIWENPELQEKFNELMKRTPYKGDDWDENSVFTDEEIEFLGRF